MFVNKYPYTDMHELNLDWLLGQMLQLRTDMKNFVNQNTIKYADPILWDITSQYESNTVVVDAGGNAYLSTQPVPAGVNINNMDYWTSIGNFSLLFASVKESIAAADEGTSTYASANRAVGDLVWLNNILYEVTAPISTGQSYVIGTNIDETTIEDELEDIRDIIRELPSLPIFNIADYDILPDTNIYDKLFDFLHDVIYPRGGGIVFFPKGRYTLDYTIFIPDNTILVGEGDDTVIYFDQTDMYFGCAFANGGSNIGIYNMCIEIVNTGQYKIGGSLPNGIGIGDTAFLGNEKRSHTIVRQNGNHNIIINNVNMINGNYCIQIEPELYKVSDIFIKDHKCPHGMFSVYPLSDNILIENVFADNIICDTVRIGNGSTGECNINLNNVYCTQMAIKSSNVTINNFQLKAGAGNRASDSPQYSSTIIITGDNVKLTNGTIDATNNSAQTRLLHCITEVINHPDVFLSNIKVIGESSYTDTNLSRGANIFHDSVEFNPYSGYDGLYDYAGNASSGNAPSVIELNAAKGKNHIVLWCMFNDDHSAKYKICSLNTVWQGSKVSRAGSGTAMLMDYLDRSKGCESAYVTFDPTDNSLYLRRIGTVPSTPVYNSAIIDIVW